MNVESGVNLEQVSRVKEGWLLKRGEHIKNWRQRYFLLYENGYLLGFREKPQTSTDFSNPLNTYNLKSCQIMKSDAPKRNAFIIRGMFGKTVVERLFGAENAAKREEWCTSIQFVAEKMKFEEAMRTSSFDKPGAPHAPIVHDSHKRKRRFSIGTVENARDGRRKITLDDFEFIKVLGKGTFGKVILCREKQTHALYAIKILKKEMVIGKNEIEHTLTENRVLQSCKHPFITQLKYSFQTNDRLCFVMEYVNGGELFFHLSRSPGKVFPENKARFYSAEIASALGYLHEHGIVYRDLKLENLLLDKDGHIKIADFGLCKEYVSTGAECKTFCGTPEYLAPEVLDESRYGRAVDWWALGVVSYEMMCGKLPFFNKNHDVMFEMILVTKVQFPKTLSPHARSVLTELLVKDPAKRLGGGPNDVKDIQSHVFFANINWQDLVNRRYRPPFKPEVETDIDTRYFDETFTGASVELTPPKTSPLTQELSAISEVPDPDEYSEDDEPRFDEFSYHRSASDPLVSSQIEMANLELMEMT